MSRKVRVKFVSKNPVEQAQFTELPNRHPELEFILDPLTRNYDWLVVYDDLPHCRRERFPLNSEKLSCSPQNTILLTYEPSSVKFYGVDYVNQFAYVLTSQEPEALPHIARYDAPPVGKWHYGGVADAMRHITPPEKSRQACIFLSAKRWGRTIRKRFEFQKKLTQTMPELDLYGRDIFFVEKKAECLDHYRYTVAAENHTGPHHWTEKLSDSFLGYCLPFYIGCPNAEDYFPEESFIRLDMDDARGAVDTIREAIVSQEYERRLPAVIEARRRVIEEYNLPNIIGDIIAGVPGTDHTTQAANLARAPQIHSRRSVIRKKPVAFLRYAFGKLRAQRRNMG